MTNTNFPLTADSDLDDLPRTLRREHEARAREAQNAAPSGFAPQYAGRDDGYAEAASSNDAIPATVTRFDVPFFQLMSFFLKAVFAAIPALIVLGVILWVMGQTLQTLYPDLVKMKILISFPN